MENLLRAALLDWLRGDPTLAARINIVAEEAPPAAQPPWLGIAASASTDWSTKDRRGREIRVAVELHTRGGGAGADAALIAAVERRIEALPSSQPGFTLVTTQFLRARSEKRARNLRSALLEYRFRLFQTPTE